MSVIGKKQVYGRQDGCGKVGHTLVFCARDVNKKSFLLSFRNNQ